ncbi:ubiquitin-conjugating enzyme [Bombardia bombarda]|uniref:E2 ubiquitin-conjugating enzyme n=1 Tax=Bombardia bombarda TaxID=252184 RepID=A0AA40CFL2_9PEZI|nr:ubiquitin-conjugating enzyme [Bombardia bombarda]
MAQQSLKRIAKELADCKASPPTGMSIDVASEADMRRWHVVLEGPANSAYAGGKFGIVVVLPAEYPFKPPTVTFATRIYHPNVTNDSSGNICLSLLKPENWKPATRLLAVLEAVRSLLVEPMPDDPLESRIADEYRSDRNEYNKNANQYVQRYAMRSVSFDAAANEGGKKGSGGH